MNRRERHRLVQRDGGAILETAVCDRRQLRHCSMIEKIAGSQPDTLAFGPCDDLQTANGIAAEGKEVIVAADAREAQDRGPDGGQRLFDRGVGRDIGLRQRRPRRVGRGQGGAVELAVGGERPGGNPDDSGRDHVVGERGQKRRAQRVERRLGGAARPQIGDQPAVGALAGGQHDGLGHGGLARERGFDLAELDAEATEFHLVVAAPEKLQRPRGAPARQVPGAIEARARRPPGSGTKHAAVSAGCPR